MLKVGVTGCFGSGKSTALEYFKDEGFPVINLDRIVSKLYRDNKIKEKILKGFGTVNKQKLSEVIFSSPVKKRKLELILHAPALKEMNLQIKKLEQRMTKLKKKKKKIVFVEVPLLFEAKLEKKFNKIVVVELSKKMCVERLLKKGFSEKEILERLDSQMGISKKTKKADFVINNSKNKNTLRTQIKKICSELINEC
ncbi:MAG: dephospho-CoA kinase [Candidatus Diapherotrites archaeon]